MQRNSFWRFVGHFAKQGKRTNSQGKRLGIEYLEDRCVPAPLTWTAGVSLPTARAGVAAVQSSSGSSVILGGNSGEIDVPTFAAANPSWQTKIVYATPLDQPRFDAGAGILPDGSYMIFGGQDAEGDPLGSAYNFSTALANMNSASSEFGFATDENHLVYAIGGQSNSGVSSLVEVYSQSANAWTTLAHLPKALFGLSAVADLNGHLFAFGGTNGSTIYSSVYRYTIATNTWDSVAALPVATKNSAAVLAPNGLIYVLGGITSTGTTANVECYNEQTNTWTVQTPLPVPLNSEAVTVDSLGRIVVADGFDANGNATSGVYFSQQLNQPDAAPVITSATTAPAYANQVYNYQVFSTGNPQPTYALISAPSGMTIDPNTGLISWTASATQVGSYSVSVQASNYAGSTSQTYTLSVVPPPPTGLAAAGASTSSIALSWNEVYDPTGVTYAVTEQKWVSDGGGKGSHGGHYVYISIASGLTTNSYTVGGLTTGSSHTYYVVAVDNATGISTAPSATATGETWYAPTLSPFVLLGGAVMSDPVATVGQPISVSMISAGNPNPSFTILTGPSTLSIDANTGIVTYQPDGSSLGLVYYTVQATNAVSSVTQTYGFDVVPAPTIIFNDGPFTFNGYAFYATATAVGSDGVTPVNGSFVITYSGPSNPPSFAGTYTVTANFSSGDSNYGSTTATSTMIINPAPAVFSSLRSPTIPVGQAKVSLSGYLTDGALAPASGTIDITLNGVTYATALGAGDYFSTKLPSASLAAGKYTLTYSYVPGDPDYTAQPATSTLYVGAKPKVTTQPLSQTVAAGGTVTFTAAATGTPMPTVQWQLSKNGGKSFANIAGATSTTFTFTASLGQNGYEYRAVFTNALATAKTTVATLTVQTAAAVTFNPISAIVSPGFNTNRALVVVATTETNYPGNSTGVIDVASLPLPKPSTSMPEAKTLQSATNHDEDDVIAIALWQIDRMLV